MRSLKGWRLVVLLGALCVSSCGSSKKAPTASESAGRIVDYNDEAAGQMAMEKKYADYKNDVVLDKDGRVGKDSKRSNFEGKQLTTIGGGWAGKEYAASRYAKKSWQGTKGFDRSQFSGKSSNRWDDQEWFLQKQAQEASSSFENGKAYATSNYRTGSASEQSGYRMSKSNNVQTDIRREVFQQPLKMDNEDYEKMSLNDSKRLLGRDE
ncbi:hypothetical protein [Roseibacillus persicicus]|nr:hypothetical protein [Roseibacillus persicicus]MDQ8188829.1 hypothetical protein [Roseibacillus persicicus]